MPPLRGGHEAEGGGSHLLLPRPHGGLRPSPENPFYEEAPCLVVEVLSPHAEAVDRREKLWRFLSLPSLKGYLLVSAERPLVEVYRKEGEEVLYQALEAGELILPCLEGALSVEAIYAGVDLEPQGE